MAFIGIKVTTDTARLLKQIDIPGEKVSDSEYHITLACFDDNLSIENICKAVEASYEVISKTKPFLVSTEEVSCFPKREGSPCAIIAKINSKELHKLNEKIKNNFDEHEINYSKLYKEYNPHITLAYGDEEIESVPMDAVEFVVHEVVLWGGDHGDDKLFVTIPLKGPEVKKNSKLIDKMENFCKLAESLAKTHDQRGDVSF